MEKIVAGLDIETVDPDLKDAGYSWKFGRGKILCTALYYPKDNVKKVIAGLHTDYCTEKERAEGNAEVKSLLTDPNVCIMGANLQYDIGWLLHEYGMTTYEVKCSFVDVLQAEHLLDEFVQGCSLEYVSQKYLHYGKRKAAIEDWILQNVPHARGDFRQYLEAAPWDLLCDYVLGDAENPCEVWKHQLPLLKEQKLCARVKLEFDCMLPTLQITMNGYPFDNERRKTNRDTLEHYRNMFAEQFRTKYGLPKFNVNSSRDIASFCDSQHIPYSCKITAKGRFGVRFESSAESSAALKELKKYVASMQMAKGEAVCFVPSTLAERTRKILENQGFMLTCSPNVDKHFFASAREAYPEIGVIADWKACNSILSKILGDDFERFVSFDSDGQTRIRPQFSITDTVSLRYSCSHANLQQIPSKNGLTVMENGCEKNISFPSLTRALFTAEKGKVLIKADFSQEEQRLLAHYAVGEGSDEVRKAYSDNPHLDFHQYVVDLTGLTRKFAKNMSFGVTYGMSTKTMAATFGWSMDKAEEISEQYHSKMPFIAPTFDFVREVFSNYGYVRTICGAKARLPAGDKNRSFTALNRLCQGGGADILKSAIVRAYRDGLWERLDVKNTIHDELNFSVPPTEQGVLDTFMMTDYMMNTVKLKVPLLCEPEVGTCWTDGKLIPEWIEARDSDSDEWRNTSEEVRMFVNIAERLHKEGKIAI